MSRRLSRHSGMLTFALVVSLVAPTSRAQKLDVAAALGQSIIESDQPMRQVQDYTEARVPTVPKPESAAQWRELADQWRRDALEKVVFRGEAARWRDAHTAVQYLETIKTDAGYHIRKLRYEALPGLWVPALLYLPDHLEGKVPVVMNVNGHDSKNGKAAAYKQLRCINQAKRGMIALNVEWLGMGQLNTQGFNHYRINQLDLCGTAGVAVHFLSMKRGLDLLLALEHADPKRVAVAGLSGGGWQTIFISSLDTRVKLCNPVAGYSSFRTRARYLSDLGDSEQTPSDLATVVDYAHLTAMLAPRAALLTFNAQDNCCFRADHALQPLLDAAEPVYKMLGNQKLLRWHVNEDPGTHNFDRDNREALYQMIGDVFYSDKADYSAKDIASDDELRTKAQLLVELPSDNLDFHELAVRLSRDLPRDAALPTDKPAADAWRQSRRAELAKIVSAKTYEVKARRRGQQKGDDASAVFWQLDMTDGWSVPAVELGGEQAKSTALLIADDGRKSAASDVSKRLADGQRVLAIDPFYFGESKIAQRDFLFALLVAAVGQRPLGLQASQVAAAARWSSKEHPGAPVTLVAHGPRSSLIALVAAALEPDAIAGVELHGSFASLRDIIEQDITVNQKPELFCFGLLARFDVLQLAALSAPRPVRFIDADDRLKATMAPLQAWYALHGAKFDGYRAAGL